MPVYPSPFRAGLAALGLLALAACQRTIINVPGQTPPTETTAVALVTSTPERQAMLKELDGQGEVRTDASGDWAPTSAGLILGVGNQFRTGADSRAFIQLTEGSKIRLGPDTALTFNILNPFMDSLLTSVALDRGETWVMLTGASALDVETPLGLASARGSYMSVAYDAAEQQLFITCLQGTCSFDQTFIPAGYKLERLGQAAALPEPMAFVDYGRWGLNVPEATELVAYATEAVAQGSATLPVVAQITPTPTPQPEPTSTQAPPAGDTPEATAAPTLEATLPPPPTVNFPPATLRPTLPAIGEHHVQAGETVFCIGRVYGVLPDAIIQANDLRPPYTVRSGQTLRIPAVPWTNISAGPVCAPQFQSPYPGLTFSTDTPTPPPESPTPAGPLEIREVAALCVGNCDNQEPTYRLLIIVTTAGGAEPLQYDPGQKYELDFPRCTKSSGTVTVTAADGQVATSSWVYDDPVCTPSP